MPSRVRRRIKSDSNSATIARTLNISLPTASVGVVHGSAQAEADLPGGELVGDGARVWQGPGEAVDLGHHEGVAGSAGGEDFAQSGRSRLVPVRP